MEHAPDMYSKALLLRRQKEKPKKHDSVLPDEKEDGESIDPIDNSSTSSGEDIQIETETNNEPTQS